MIRKSVAVLLFAVTLPALAQADRTLTAAERSKLAELLPHLLETIYVIPDKGKELAGAMRASFASGGKYGSATTTRALAEAINTDLAAANDRHLRMQYNPDEASTSILSLAEWKERRAAGPRRERPRDTDAARLANYGVAAAEVLEGNVGYLRISGFMGPDETRAAMSSAMALLAHTDAMIVDVRKCPGGSADAVSHLASYFFGPEKRVLMNRYDRRTNTSIQSTTVDVPGRRRPDVDLYVLTGPGTASACESFSFTLQQWGRAKTVGEKTAGAGHNNMIVNAGGGLAFSISYGTAKHPKSGKGWEAVGVQPDIAAPLDRALDVARAEALKAIAANAASEPQKRAVQAAMRNLSAATADGAIAEVRAMERTWLDAYEKRDAAAMNRLVADDFVIVHSDGATQSKADVLAFLARAASAGMPPAKFVTDDVQARAYGDTVVLTGRVTMDMTRRDGTPMKRVSRYTDTWVRRNGRWQVVSSHQGDIDANARPAMHVSTRSPAPAPAVKNEDYVGRYGVREISLRDGALYYQRIGARGGVLEPLAPDQFDLNGDVVISFQRDAAGQVTSMKIQWGDGRSEVAARD